MANVNEPLADMVRLSPELFWRITVPLKPEIVPPIVYVGNTVFVGVTALEADEGELVPTAFTAYTAKV